MTRTDWLIAVAMAFDVVKRGWNFHTSRSCRRQKSRSPDLLWRNAELKVSLHSTETAAGVRIALQQEPFASPIRELIPHLGI
jgi:hypothetical protein